MVLLVTAWRSCERSPLQTKHPFPYKKKSTGKLLPPEGRAERSPCPPRCATPQPSRQNRMLGSGGGWQEEKPQTPRDRRLLLLCAKC